MLPRLRHSRLRVVSTLVVLCSALLGVVTTARAHDFWLVPYLFAFVGDSVVLDGKSGTRFPEGSAVQPTRVAEAWLIGAASRTRLVNLSVQNGALRVTAQPSRGQHLAAIALTPRTTRTTPTGLLRFLRAEGGAAAADELERLYALDGMDSVVYASASYASTVVQVGRGGAPAFASSAGFPLEFVPLTDPTALRVGDTLRVRILGGGRPAANVGLEARAAGSTGTLGGVDDWRSLQTDADGIARVPLGTPGPWLLRSAMVVRRPGPAANEFDVARSTYVFGVIDRR